MKLDRRGFLLVAGGAAGGAVTGGLTLKGLGRINEALSYPTLTYPGEEKIVTSICRACSGGCGLRVRMVGDRVVKIDGNPLYPVNRDGVCPKAQAMLQWLYHPDRVLSPRQRSKPDEKWKSITWPEAVQTLAETLRKLRSQLRQDKVMVVSGRDSGITQSLLARFLSAYGNAAWFQLPDGMEVSAQALKLMAGEPSGGEGRLAYDLENSRCVLSFGCDLLQAWGTPGNTLRVFGAWHDSTRETRTSLIHFGSRLSVSAARADEWIPARVGTWAAVALGLAYVLITEDLYNHDFVENSTFGFEDWTDASGRKHTGLRSMVREGYRLSQVSEISGVPTEDLVRVARIFAAAPGGVAIGPQQSPGQPGRLADALAVHTLNGLVGSVGARGGVRLLAENGWPLPPSQQKLPQASRSMDKLMEALDRSPEVLILDEAGPLFDLLSSAEMEKLRRIPLVVTTTSLEDVTTDWATLHLPECTPLESWVDGQSPSTYPYELLSVAAPVIPAQGESRAWGETLLALGKAADPTVAAALPWKDLPEALRASSDQLAAEQRGYMFGTSVDEQWQRMLERSGWWAPDWKSADEFWDALSSAGGWWDPVNWPADPQRSFQTASGRFEFYSRQLEEWLRQQPNLPVAPSSPDWDRLVLPHHSDLLPATGADKFPLFLEPFETLSFFGNGGRELPYLQQLSSAYGDNQWRSWVELNAEDAQARGIVTGDVVWVESTAGKVRRRALVIEAAMPGIVSAPRTGPPPAGRWATEEDPLANVLIPVRDPLGGARCGDVTRVNVYKA